MIKVQRMKDSTCQDKPAALNSSSCLSLASRRRGLICSFFSVGEKEEEMRSKRGILAEMKCCAFGGAALTLMNGVLSPAETQRDDS